MDRIYVHKPPFWYSGLIILAFIYNVWIAAEFVNGFALPGIVSSYLPFDVVETQARASFSLPTWAMIGYWVAIAGGGIGCLAMLMGVAMALPSLCFALFGILVSKFFEVKLYLRYDVDLVQALTTSGVQLGIAAACIWLALWARKNEWIL